MNVRSRCKLNSWNMWANIVFENWVGYNQTSTWGRVVWGHPATGALVKFHSYPLSLCLWGLNRSYPHARGKCTCTRGITRGNDFPWTPALSCLGCLSYRKEARIGDRTIVGSLKPNGQGAATSILGFLRCLVWSAIRVIESTKDWEKDSNQLIWCKKLTWRLILNTEKGNLILNWTESKTDCVLQFLVLSFIFNFDSSSLLCIDRWFGR
jgi:hypothetical protein